MSLNFEEWYEDHVEYMHIADFKPWLGEAFDAGSKAERERVLKLCNDWDFNVQGLIRQIKEKV